MVLWGNVLLEIEIPILKLGILRVYHIRIILSCRLECKLLAKVHSCYVLVT